MRGGQVVPLAFCDAERERGFAGHVALLVQPKLRRFQEGLSKAPETHLSGPTIERDVLSKMSMFLLFRVMCEDRKSIRPKEAQEVALATQFQDGWGRSSP